MPPIPVPIEKHLSNVNDKLKDVPYMTLAQASRLAKFMIENNIKDCLELGCYQGKSTAFLSAILKHNGGGTVTTVDRTEALDHSPNVHEVLERLDLADIVTVFLERRSLTWRLMKMLEEAALPRFDFCYFDGGHSWDVTGFAFLLVDRLLRPGGWVLFDDLGWTYSSMLKPGKNVPGWLANMPDEERTTPQVRKVWELLVKTSSNYTDFREEGQWAFARKTHELS